MNFSLNTSAIDGMLVDNNAGGTLTVNVTGCTYTGVTTSVSQNKALLQFESGGAANVTANVQNSFFNGSRTYGLYATGAGTSILNVTLNQSGFGTDVNTGAAVNNPGTAITNPPAFAVGITNGSGAQVDYVVSGNTFWGADGLLGAVYAVTVSGASTTGASHLNGSFTNNRIGKTGVVGSGCANGCAGLGSPAGHRRAQFKATVSGNDIRQVNALGISFFNCVESRERGIDRSRSRTTPSPSPIRRARRRSSARSSCQRAIAAARTCLSARRLAARKLRRTTISGSWQVGNFIRVTTINIPA